MRDECSRMKKRIWIKIIVLGMVIGTISWSGAKTTLSAEPNGQLTQPPLPGPPSVSPQPVAPATPPVSPPTSPAAPLTPAAPSVQPITPRSGQNVVLNFDNADLYEVIRVMAEIMKIHYIIDPRVKGVVNIHTSGQLPAADIFPIFQSILRLNGATAVKRDGVYEIVPLTEAKKYVHPLGHAGPHEIGSGRKICNSNHFAQIYSSDRSFQDNQTLPF